MDTALHSLPPPVAHHAAAPPSIALEPSPPEEPIAASAWWALAAVCLGVVLVVADNTIVNVALPTLGTELGASTGGLQWMVDAYLLVFAGLLLPFGALGDRLGRRRALVCGLVVLAAASTAAAVQDSLGGLIACRLAMGVGAAAVFPATLSIVTATFPAGRARRLGVAVWSATVGVGVIVGPLLGGFLLERSGWGSVFLVNLPVALVAIGLTLLAVTETRDTAVARLDPLGAVLSFGAVTAFVFAIIEGPARGWTSPATLGTAVGGLVLGAAFAAWERHHPAPMLPRDMFAQPAFTAPVVVLALATSALFGFVFVATQYFQIVTGLGAFASGVRYLPFAVALIVTALRSPRLVARHGAPAVVTTGMVVLGAAMAGTTLLGRTSGFLPTVAVIVTLLGIGMGLITAPATELLMAQVPEARAGIGSGMNDTARQLGGAFGVAVLGSVFSSTYASELRAAPETASLDPAVLERLAHSPSQALRAATGPGGDPTLVGAVQDAFVGGMHTAALVGAATALLGAVAGATLLRRATVHRRRRAAP